MKNVDRSPRTILLFWAPLAAQWLMMAAESPFLAAVIARLLDPTFNLAAYGVAYAFAILVESPVIMLMSASTALVDGGESYRRLRNFANALNAFATGLLLLVLVPPVYATLMSGMLGLPDPVTALLRGALWILLPWPAAIGYRRFLHGLLIRSGRTRLVAYGTLLRLLTMVSTAIGAAAAGLPGAWVGAAALSAGVVVEAAVARVMAAGVIRELLGGSRLPRQKRGARSPGARGRRAGTRGAVAGVGPAVESLEPEAVEETGGGAEPVVGSAAAAGPSPEPAATYLGIARFYYPLALTSLIGLTVQPILTFFMGRAPSPVESLAVFPVVHALSFLFRALGLSFQEAAIALLGPNCEHARELGRFALGLALAAAGGLGLVAFTPLAGVWFETISGLPPELADMAIVPARVLVVLPALSVAISFQRAILVQRRRTRPITIATALEVVGIAALFPAMAWGIGMTGVTAAMTAFVGGRILGVLFLVSRTVRA